MSHIECLKLYDIDIIGANRLPHTIQQYNKIPVLNKIPFLVTAKNCLVSSHVEFPIEGLDLQPI